MATLGTFKEGKQPSDVEVVFLDLESTGIRIGIDEIYNFACIGIDSNFSPIFHLDLWTTPFWRLQPTSVESKGLLSPMETIIRGKGVSTMSKIWDISDTLNQFKHAYLCGHNIIKFDSEMLKASAGQYNLDNKFDASEFKGMIDTLTLYRKHYTGKANLTAMAKNLGVTEANIDLFARVRMGADFGGRHSALYDTTMTLLSLRKICEVKGVTDFAQLLPMSM